MNMKKKDRLCRAGSEAPMLRTRNQANLIVERHAKSVVRFTDPRNPTCDEQAVLCSHTRLSLKSLFLPAIIYESIADRELVARNLEVFVDLFVGTVFDMRNYFLVFRNETLLPR